MHITCQDCETIFNLDDRLLKPGGSKVRCSQCGNIFVAQPSAATPKPSLEPEPPQPSAQTPKRSPQRSPQRSTDETMGRVAASDEPQAVVEQELEGIDLAELDAILESEPRLADSGMHAREDEAALPDDSSDDLLAEEDLIEDGEDIDLDLDFDMDLEPGAGDAGAVDAEAAETDDLLSDLDLDMDFELDDGLDLEEPAAEPPHPETAQQDQPEKIKEPVEKEGLAEEDLELALDDFDLDSVESEPDIQAAKSSSDDRVGETDAVEPDLSLDDFDLDLEEPAQEEKTVPAEASADLAFDDLDLDSGVARDDQVEDEELSLATDDLDEGTGKEAPGVDETDKGDIDQLDLDDLDLEEILNGADTQTSRDEEVQEEELSLLDDGEGQDEKVSTRGVAEEDELDLQLDDFDLGDEGDTPAESLPEEALDEEAGLEPELSFEDQATGELSDELDLSDLGGLLEESGEAIAPAQEDVPDLELSLDDGPSAEEESPSGDIELEDLDFELDAEIEDKPIAKTKEPEPVRAAAEDDEELDLSDIEQMLEGDTILEPSSDSAETASVEKPESLGASLGDELDLGEIEASIDLSEEEEAAKAQGDEEPELDLDLSSADTSAEASEAIAELEELDLDLELEESPEDSGSGEGALDLELDLEDAGGELELELEEDRKTPQAEEALDLSDLGDLVLEEKEGVKSETIDTGDIELEFEVQEDVPVQDYDPGTSQTFETGMLPIGEAVMPQHVPAKSMPRPRPRKKKRGTSKLLVFILILAMIGVGGFYAYDPYIKPFLEKNDIQIQIPYLSQFLNPKPKDPAGTFNLSVLDINSKFIESDKNGRLFVISGKVRNGYGNKRGIILLNGKLFSKGKVLVKSEQVYAGVMISDQDLKATPIAEIQLRLRKMPGPRDANTSVHPGQTLPFMVVFSDLPGDLDEFVVEKVSSQQVP